MSAQVNPVWMVRHASIRLITIVAPARRDTKEETAKQVSFFLNGFKSKHIEKNAGR